MKPFLSIIFCFLDLGVDSQRWFQFMKEAGQGTRDMWRAYTDMREANWKNSDKYFHARGNYDAAQRGPGGAWAAKVISDAREGFKRMRGRGIEDSRADQFANEWGRSGKDPNFFRPPGLPSKY
nr:serum amyloid A [Mesocricetus auratus]